MELIRPQSIIRDPFVARAAADVLRKHIVTEGDIVRLNNNATVFNAFQESAKPGKQIQDAIRNIKIVFKNLEAANESPDSEIQEITEEEVVSALQRSIGGNLISISSAAQEIAQSCLPLHITDSAEDVMRIVGKLGERDGNTMTSRLSNFLRK